MPSAPILRPVRTNNVGEDPAAIFSHDTPRQRYDLPASRVYTFELEQPLAAGAQNENPCGSAAISGSLEEGPSRSRTAEPPFVNQSLISFSPSAEFDPRYEHELLRASLGSGISTRNDAGPSGSMFITSVSFRGAYRWHVCINGPYLPVGRRSTCQRKICGEWEKETIVF